MKKTKEQVRRYVYEGQTINRQYTTTQTVYETKKGLSISVNGYKVPATRAADGVVEHHDYDAIQSMSMQTLI